MFNLLEAATPNTVIGNVIVASGAFIILIVLIRLFAWKQITGIFAARAKKISDDIDEAEKSNKQAAKLVEQREAELKGSKAEAAGIIQTAQETANQNRAKINEEAKADADATKARALAEIEQERKEALGSVKGEVASISVQIAEKLIGQNLNAEDQSALIDSYLSKLGE